MLQFQLQARKRKLRLANNLFLLPEIFFLLRDRIFENILLLKLLLILFQPLPNPFKLLIQLRDHLLHLFQRSPILLIRLSEHPQLRTQLLNIRIQTLQLSFTSIQHLLIRYFLR